jgi:riboflavin kinase/FMN adenylyltransferase
MKTVNGIRSLGELDRSTVVTIGNYDGVHLGHREILSKLLNEARKTGSYSTVFTFHPHPRKVLFPEKEFSRIFDIGDQVEQLESLGVDFLVVEPFSRELSQTPARDFFESRIFQPLKPKKLFVGYDFSFGADRKGSRELLERLSVELSFDLETVPAFKVGGEIVSSSRIREAVLAGDVNQAQKQLGRRFYLKGIVEKGDGRGRTIGIPTANLNTSAELLPASGVYATKTILGESGYWSVTNIGRNPTFLQDVARPRVETHILDFDRDIYGKSVRIEFIEKIRPEMKFTNGAELVNQIKSDIAVAKKITSGLKPL